MRIQIGFKIFLNITPAVANWTSDNKQFSLVFDENPLADFVELPDDGRAQDELWFSNILCGVLRGALEMVSSPLILKLKSCRSYDGLQCIRGLLTCGYRCKCRLRPISSVTSFVETILQRCAYR